MLLFPETFFFLREEILSHENFPMVFCMPISSPAKWTKPQVIMCEHCLRITYVELLSKPEFSNYSEGQVHKKFCYNLLLPSWTRASQCLAQVLSHNKDSKMCQRNRYIQFMDKTRTKTFKIFQFYWPHKA